jgi:adenine-specific DNA methylase
MTPLVADWYLLKPKSGIPIVAKPVVNTAEGTWTTEVRPVGVGTGAVKGAPPRTYGAGQGISLFTNEPIPAAWIKTQAKQGKMASALYAVAMKTPQGLQFRPPQQADLDALEAAEAQLEQLRGDWEKRNLIPTELIPDGSKTREPLQRGFTRWADMFSPRQLLAFGVLMEELHLLRPEIVAEEGDDMGEAVVHLLAFAVDKFTNYNCAMASWHTSHQVIRGLFDRHDLRAAPLAVRRGKNTIADKFAEFRAWHAMLQPVFGLTPPDWTEKKPDQAVLDLLAKHAPSENAEDGEADVLVIDEEHAEEEEEVEE